MAELTVEQAQKVVDYVANRLSGADSATAERLLDGVVARFRQLDDLANVRRLIEEGNEKVLAPLGGLGSAKNMVFLVETIGRA